MAKPKDARSKRAAAAFGVREEMASGEDCVAALARHLALAWPLSGKGTQSLRFLGEYGDDLLRKAAAHVLRLRLRHAGHFRDAYDRRLLAPPKKPSLRLPLPVVTDNAKPAALTSQQQQMRAAQLYYFEQRRSAAWETHCKVRGSRPLGQWPPQQQQQQQAVRPGNVVKAVFLNSSVAKKASTGTGFFLPRIHGSKPEPRKTPDDRRQSQSNAMVSPQKSKSELVQPTSIVSGVTRLPHEWTY